MPFNNSGFLLTLLIRRAQKFFRAAPAHRSPSAFALPLPAYTWKYICICVCVYIYIGNRQGFFGGEAGGAALPWARRGKRARRWPRWLCKNPSSGARISVMCARHSSRGDAGRCWMRPCLCEAREFPALNHRAGSGWAFPLPLAALFSFPPQWVSFV